MLIDTSFLYSVYNVDDQDHDRSLALIENHQSSSLIPQVILPEVGFLFLRDGGHRAVLRFMEAFVSSQAHLVAITNDDWQRATEIGKQYANAEFDIVDCCIMALSERMGIQQIATYDRRDFSIFRPKHCDYFELLPT